MSKCECRYHKFSVVHICKCGNIISESVDDRQNHFTHGIAETIPSHLYRHGDSVETLQHRLDMEKRKEAKGVNQFVDFSLVEA